MSHPTRPNIAHPNTRTAGHDVSKIEILNVLPQPMLGQRFCKGKMPVPSQPTGPKLVRVVSSELRALTDPGRAGYAGDQ